MSDDFLIRQLYYPFRAWKNRITKPVRPLFLVYSNGIYHIYEYTFTDPNNYSSIALVQQKSYAVEDTVITSDDIQQLLHSIVCEEEPQLPFPQADTFKRVINICELLSDQDLSRSDVTDLYAFDTRQTDYYTDAARYLGLVEKCKNDGGSMYKLSEKGRKILKLGYKQRQLSFCSCILSHRVFADTLKQYFKTGIMPQKSDIVQMMKSAALYSVKKESTFDRRASTVKGWINWIVELISE